MVVVFDLDTIVGMDAAAILYVQVVMAETIVVGNDVHPWKWRPLDLAAQAFSRIGGTVGLPSVDDPRLDLQVGTGKYLDSHTFKKPWRIGRNVRRLIRPVVVVVITEQADVRHENSGVDVDPVQHVEVITAVGFCQVAIGISDIPLSLGVTWVIAHGRRGIHAELSHQSGANIVEVK